MAIYEKPTRLLMIDMVKDISMKKGDRILKDQVISWFNEKYPKIKQGTITAHLIRMSINAKSRHHYNPRPIEDDLFYQIDGNSFRLFDIENDPSPLRRESSTIDEIKSDEPDINEENTSLRMKRICKIFYLGISTSLNPVYNYLRMRESPVSNTLLVDDILIFWH